MSRAKLIEQLRLELQIANGSIKQLKLQMEEVKRISQPVDNTLVVSLKEELKYIKNFQQNSSF